jgi:hypothetical protein
MPGLGGRGAAGAGATSAGLEAAAALDFGAAALRGVGFAFLAADFFGALFLAAECFFFRDRAALFAFFVFLVFDFVFFAMIVLPIARHYSVRFNRVAVQRCLLKTSSIGGILVINEVLRRETGYHTCPLGADIAAAARIPFAAHRHSVVTAHWPVAAERGNKKDFGP